MAVLQSVGVVFVIDSNSNLSKSFPHILNSYLNYITASLQDRSPTYFIVKYGDFDDRVKVILNIADITKELMSLNFCSNRGGNIIKSSPIEGLCAAVEILDSHPLNAEKHIILITNCSAHPTPCRFSDKYQGLNLQGLSQLIQQSNVNISFVSARKGIQVLEDFVRNSNKKEAVDYSQALDTVYLAGGLSVPNLPPLSQDETKKALIQDLFNKSTQQPLPPPAQQSQKPMNSPTVISNSYQATNNSPQLSSNTAQNTNNKSISFLRQEQQSLQQHIARNQALIPTSSNNIQPNYNGTLTWVIASNELNCNLTCVPLAGRNIPLDQFGFHLWPKQITIQKAVQVPLEVLNQMNGVPVVQCSSSHASYNQLAVRLTNQKLMAMCSLGGDKGVCFFANGMGILLGLVFIREGGLSGFINMVSAAGQQQQQQHMNGNQMRLSQQQALLSQFAQQQQQQNGLFK